MIDLAVSGMVALFDDHAISIVDNLERKVASNPLRRRKHGAVLLRPRESQQRAMVVVFSAAGDQALVTLSRH
jgi:hypothetical protein